MARRHVLLYPSLPAALGERQAILWQAIAFEFQMVLRGFQDAFEQAADQLRSALTPTTNIE